MDVFSPAVLAFMLATHGTGTIGLDTTGAPIGRLRIVNDFVQPFGRPLVLGAELAMQPVGGAYQPKLTGSIELMLLKF